MGTGDYQQAYEEASLLALVLRTGALPAPVSVGEVRTVGPTLGADLIASGSLASVIALGLVTIFMIWFYRFSGILANIALGLPGGFRRDAHPARHRRLRAHRRKRGGL